MLTFGNKLKNPQLLIICMKQIGQGAEAVLHSDEKTVRKDRVKKSYRHPEIDKKLRQFRTRREAKVIQRLQELNIPGPRLVSVDDKTMQIDMSFVEGDKVRDILTIKNHYDIAFDIGKKIGQLHKHGIMHGDLTTSNMIYHEKDVHFIDFGLSFFSDKLEDRAVDLHLFRQALESKHHKIWQRCFEAAVAGYKECYPEAEAVLERLKKVESRGRYKDKY